MRTFMMRDDGHITTPKPAGTDAPLGKEMRSYIQHMREALASLIRSKRLMWAIAYSAVVFVLLRRRSTSTNPFSMQEDLESPRRDSYSPAST